MWWLKPGGDATAAPRVVGTTEMMTIATYGVNIAHAHGDVLWRLHASKNKLCVKN